MQFIRRREHHHAPAIVTAQRRNAIARAFGGWQRLSSVASRGHQSRTIGLQADRFESVNNLLAFPLKNLEPATYDLKSTYMSYAEKSAANDPNPRNSLTMKQRTRATWTSRNERDLWCRDFSGLDDDRPGLLAEIEASQAVIRRQPADSLLVAIVLRDARLPPELVAFLNACACPERNPIHKLAILGVSPWQRLWHQRARGVTWPTNARFFDDYELAKDWLVADRF